ncbi:MAG: bacT [Acidobacteria bacterium]|nr:bacT [Acidobacteriota bacterium]
MTEPKRILVVDDDAAVRDLLTSVLEHRGLTVDTAADGREALQLFTENQYSVIILDLLMPVVDGFGFLRGMESVDLQVPPVVLVVTGADRALVKQLDPQRIHGVIRKPFDAQELASLVVACAEIKSRNSYGTMAIATMMAGGPFLALLNRLT